MSSQQAQDYVPSSSFYLIWQWRSLEVMEPNGAYACYKDSHKVLINIMFSFRNVSWSAAEIIEGF